MTEIVSFICSKSITSRVKREFLNRYALAPFALMANWPKTSVRVSLCVAWKSVVLINL